MKGSDSILLRGTFPIFAWRDWRRAWKPSVRLAGFRIEVWSKDLPHMTHEYHPLNGNLRFACWTAFKYWGFGTTKKKRLEECRSLQLWNPEFFQVHFFLWSSIPHFPWHYLIRYLSIIPAFSLSPSLVFLLGYHSPFLNVNAMYEHACFAVWQASHTYRDYCKALHLSMSCGRGIQSNKFSTIQFNIIYADCSQVVSKTDVFQSKYCMR